MKKYYRIKQIEDHTKCPLCGSKLGGCHVGEYCSNDECPYVDGFAALTKEEAEKYRDKIIVAIFWKKPIKD